MMMAKTTAVTTRERLHALVHELNFKGMARVLDAELDRAERDAVPAAELVQRLLAEQASSTGCSPRSSALSSEGWRGARWGTV